MGQVCFGLAQPDPFRLDEGERALKQAWRAKRAAFDRPVGGSAVLVEVSA